MASMPCLDSSFSSSGSGSYFGVAEKAEEAKAKRIAAVSIFFIAISCPYR